MMGDCVWFRDVSWHASYAIYFFVIGILAGLSFLSYGSWITPALRPLREKAAYLSLVLLAVGGLLPTALVARGLPLYTGYDLTVHQSRPVWNTPVMPVLFVALAIASGSAVGSL